jgi:hypothetical protein
VPRVNFNQVLKSLDGKNILLDDKEEFSFRKAAVGALLGSGGTDATLTGSKKAERYELALKVSTAEGVVDITAQEAEEIKKVVGETYAPIVVGQVFRLLDGSIIVAEG